MGWVTDLFRTAWGLLYWNVRKSVFRLRRRRSRCPCQNPSDSGRAWETACEAAVTWHRPARFRLVCPLLKPAPDGALRCSVDTADVRPFWGRAFGLYAGSAAAAYLTAALVAFAVLHGIGYRVTPWTVAWPPAWPGITVARGEYFFEKAVAAYNDHRINEAIMALSLAYEIDPRNHGAGLLLAQLWQVGQAALSDRIYARLMQEHPAERPATAQAWYRALLPRGDFPTIAHLSADALRFDAPHAPAWLHALLFATRKTGDAAPLKRVLESPEPLPDEIRALLQLELLVLTAPRDEAVAALVRPPNDPATPYSIYYRINRLLQLGAGSEALGVFERSGPRLGERERIATQLDLFAVLGWGPLRRTAIETLLMRPLNLPVVEILAAHLIRHPEPELAGLLFARQATGPLEPVAANYSGYTALFCLAGAYGDQARLQEMGLAIKQISGTAFISLAGAEAFFQQPEQSRRIEAILPVLQPLPLDVTYALLERFGRPPRPLAAAAP